MKMVATPKIASCLETTCHDYSRADGFTMIAYENHGTDSRIKEVEISPTVTARWGTGGNNVPLAMPGSGWRSNGTPVEAVAIQNMAVRRLTPVECERLQGFSDNYTNIPKAPDGNRYKALGNSMAVPVMRWIGERINNYERL
jgi:DNA (cytosine-5)-methyltransferase 1